MILSRPQKINKSPLKAVPPELLVRVPPWIEHGSFMEFIALISKAYFFPRHSLGMSRHGISHGINTKPTPQIRCFIVLLPVVPLIWLMKAWDFPMGFSWDFSGHPFWACCNWSTSLETTQFHEKFPEWSANKCQHVPTTLGNVRKSHKINRRRQCREFSQNVPRHQIFKRTPPLIQSKWHQNMYIEKFCVHRRLHVMPLKVLYGGFLK